LPAGNAAGAQVPGGAIAPRIPVTHSIGLIVGRKRNRGSAGRRGEGIPYHRKIKVGVDPERDVAMVRRICETVGRIAPRIDANQGYRTAGEAIRTYRHGAVRSHLFPSSRSKGFLVSPRWLVPSMHP
jgi:L-alanine-DL-glutamate epimerase-like enolase superfamily enzyme